MGSPGGLKWECGPMSGPWSGLRWWAIVGGDRPRVQQCWAAAFFDMYSLHFLGFSAGFIRRPGPPGQANCPSRVIDLNAYWSNRVYDRRWRGRHFECAHPVCSSFTTGRRPLMRRRVTGVIGFAPASSRASALGAWRTPIRWQSPGVRSTQLGKTTEAGLRGTRSSCVGRSSFAGRRIMGHVPWTV